jgi:ankyrin repeat protein/DNA-binding transcriptional regulator YiaG
MVIAMKLSAINHESLASKYEQGKRVKQLRLITHLSRRAFAEKHGLPMGSIQNMEEGRYKNGLTQRVTRNFITALQAEGIECTMEWLLYGSGFPPQHRFGKTISYYPEPQENEKRTNLIVLAEKNEKKHKLNATFFEAVATGKYHQVLHLIEYGIEGHLLEGIKVKPYDSEHNTALHIATLNAHLKIMKYLLKNGANVNAINRSNQTPLHFTILNNRKAFVKLLINYNADINASDEEGDTPLAWAAYKGQIEMINILIKLGANIFTKNNIGNTPLHWAAEKGYIDIVKVLIEKGADHLIKNQEGMTPILAATNNGHVDTVKLLLQINNSN